MERRPQGFPCLNRDWPTVCWMMSPWPISGQEAQPWHATLHERYMISGSWHLLRGLPFQEVCISIPGHHSVSSVCFTMLTSPLLVLLVQRSAPNTFLAVLNDVVVYITHVISQPLSSRMCEIVLWVHKEMWFYGPQVTPDVIWSQNQHSKNSARFQGKYLLQVLGHMSVCDFLLEGLSMHTG